MTVDIISAILIDKVLTIEAIDTSEENLMRLERRDDGCEKLITFIFDTSDPKTFKYLDHWLHSQKRVREKAPKTYGDAIRLTVGTRVNLNAHYREWE